MKFLFLSILAQHYAPDETPATIWSVWDALPFELLVIVGLFAAGCAASWWLFIRPLNARNKRAESE